MVEPNFSESQLQSCVNTEITMSLFSRRNEYFIAQIPSLRIEAELAWDTGFYFPWLFNPLQRPLHNHENFQKVLNN